MPAALLGPRRGRVALVVAHPDDESIAAGGHLPQLEDPIVIVATDGAPMDPRCWGVRPCARVPTRAAYADLRRAELEDALAVCNFGPERLRMLGFTDQTLAHELPVLTQSLRALFLRENIGLVITHTYEAGHPDHDAVAFAVQSARESLGPAAPEAIEFPAYHRGASGEMVCGRFADTNTFALCLTLSPDAALRKARMLEAHASQRETLAPFGTNHEWFRRAPRHDFTRPPHDRGAYYEGFEWGLTSRQWFGLARAARRLLGLPC